MGSLELSQWLHELYGEQKCPKKIPYKRKHAYICMENYSLFLQALSGLFPTYSTAIVLMNLSWTSCTWVDSSHLRQKSTSWVRVGSFGAVDSRRAIFRIRFKSKSMTGLVTTLILTELSREMNLWLTELSSMNLSRQIVAGKASFNTHSYSLPVVFLLKRILSMIGVIVKLLFTFCPFYLQNNIE